MTVLNQTELSALRDEAEQLQSKIKEYVAIGETRSFSDEEAEDYDVTEAKLTEVQGQIKTLERTERGSKLTGAKRSEVFGTPGIKIKSKIVAQDYDNATKAWMLGGYPETRHQIADDWKRSADKIGCNWEGKVLELNNATRHQSSDVENKGKEFVEDSIYRGFVEAKQAYGGMLAAGNVMDFPTSERSRWAVDNDTASTGAVQSAQNASLSTSSDVDTDEVFITPKTYYAKTTKIAVQQIQNAREDVLAYYGRKMARRLLKKINVDLTAALLEDVHTVEYGYSDALTYQNLGNVKFGLDPDYQAGSRVRWMGHNATKHYLWEAFADPTEGPTWGDALNAAPMGQLIGDPFVTNQHFDVMTGGVEKIPLVYGDFDNFIVHTVGQPKLIRLNELYMESLSVGIIMYWEVGGKLIDAGTHPIVALTTGTLSGDGS